MLHAFLPVLLAFQIGAAPIVDRHEASLSVDVEHGLPGEMAGTESWLVCFKERGFDLTAFRAAIRSNDASAVDRAVAELETKVEADQAGFARFVAGLGGAVKQQWWIVNGCAIEIPFDQLTKVREHARVLFIQPDATCDPIAVIKTATNSRNHNVDALQTAGVLGKGVTVAIVDTGQDSSHKSSGRPHATYFINGDITNKTGGGLGGSRLLWNTIAAGAIGPDDLHGHGTGVAGISAGAKWNKLSTSDHGHAPRAGIVGIAIGYNSRGSAKLTTIVDAWKLVAANKVKYGIVAANNSYSGRSNPLDLTQQALDSVALNADVLPVVAAGNFGASTVFSQSCANGLAVAAVNGAKGSTKDKKMATFSSRGPIYGDTQRFYPDVSANGVSTVMPKKDLESSTWVASGTSMASPQVCGAAALFRSVDTKASALQTKAAILATTEDISAQNSAAPYNSRNSYGVGYLRDDKLIALAQRKNGGILTGGRLTSAVPKKTFVLPVTAGKAYAVAIAWYRHVLTSKSWSNLSLTAKLGGTTIASSDTPRNLYEKITILAKSSGAVVLEVANTRLEVASVPFALAAVEVPPPFIQGSLRTYGKGCLGTGKLQGVATVVPTASKTVWGNSATTLLLGYYNHHRQQIVSSSQVPASFVATGIAFRTDNTIARSTNRYWAELKMDLGYSAKTPATMSTLFASNISGTMTAALAKKKVSLPYWTASNTSATNWLIKIPFDRPFVYKAQTGKHLLLDTKKFSSSAGTAYAYYYIDATYNRRSPVTSRLYQRSLTATTGYRTVGFGAVIGFTAPSTGGAIPILGSTGLPNIGTSYSLDVTQAKASAPVIFMFGFSDKKIGTITLPFDLGPFGAAGCKVLASQDYARVVLSNSSGTANSSFLVPNQKSIIQASFFFQGIIVDPTANTLGLAFTNGIAGSVGGQP